MNRRWPTTSAVVFVLLVAPRFHAPLQGQTQQELVALTAEELCQRTPPDVDKIAEAEAEAERRKRGPSAKRIEQELPENLLPMGTRVSVIGKWGLLVSDTMSFSGCSRIPLVFKSRQLVNRLAELKPAPGEMTNLIVNGVLFQEENERAISYAVRVLSVEAAPEDFALHAAALSKLAEATTASAPRDLVSLGGRILRARAGKRPDARLTPLAREAFRAAIQAAHRLSGGDVVAAKLGLLPLIRAELDDDAFIRDLLLAIEKEHPGESRVLEAFQANRCRLEGGRWVTEAEFMRREGLYEHEGRWVTRRVKHLSRALTALSGKNEDSVLLLRRRTAREYMLMATAKPSKIEPGMSREEVTLALGFPDYVLRRLHRGKEFDQWECRGQFYYFFDGILVFLPRS